ncbi:MAG TPA: transposase [Verrucomicrobiae bacterium]|nr:transposase [Verrucomicrobiae bacterium]
MSIENRPKPQRRSIRLRGYDYSREGGYFITICTGNRESLFGEIIDGQMRLNDLGLIVQKVWDELPEHYPSIELDKFVIMPNHIHGIIILVGAGLKPALSTPRAGLKPAPTGENSKKRSLAEIVRAFKTFSARRINEFRRMPGLPIWQRNYYEHIIRNESSLNKIREYIKGNPLNWALDIENPAILSNPNSRRSEEKFWNVSA